MIGIVCPLSSALAAEDAIVGRWDLTVGDSPRTAPCWLGVEKKDGKLIVQFVGEGGGVGDISDKAKIDGDHITFQAHGRKWEGTVKGHTITGTAEDDKGKKQPFVGERFVPKINVNGTWKVSSSGRRAQNATLELKQNGDQITGTWKARREVSIADAKLSNGVFSFSMPGRGGASSRTIEVNVKGDVMESKSAGRQQNFKAQREREWAEPIELFNGKDLAGWKPIGNVENSNWKVVDGVMANTAGGANIMTERAFGDFKLHVEFNIPAKSNSGVYLRGRHEIQIEDTFGRPPESHICGAIYSRLTPSVNAAKQPGEWQTFDITLIGTYVTVVHNGQTIIDNQEIEGITGGALDSKEGSPGPIYFQGDHGPVDFRKIILTPAKPTGPDA